LGSKTQPERSTVDDRDDEETMWDLEEVMKKEQWDSTKEMMWDEKWDLQKDLMKEIMWDLVEVMKERTVGFDEGNDVG